MVFGREESCDLAGIGVCRCRVSGLIYSSRSAASIFFASATDSSTFDKKESDRLSIERMAFMGGTTACAGAAHDF